DTGTGRVCLRVAAPAVTPPEVGPAAQVPGVLGPKGFDLGSPARRDLTRGAGLDGERDAAGDRHARVGVGLHRVDAYLEPRQRAVPHRLERSGRSPDVENDARRHEAQE